MARPKRKYKYLGSRGNKHPVMANRFGLTQRLREEMEKKRLKRKLEQDLIAHGQGDFPGKSAELDQMGMKAQPWVMPQDKRKMLQQQAIDRDMEQRAAEQLELQNRRPIPEPWMIPEAGFVDPNWTAEAPGSNVPPEHPRSVAMRERLAGARRVPSDFGQDDPAGYEGWSPGELEPVMDAEKKERYRRAMLNSVTPTAPSQENLKGTIYSEPKRWQYAVAKVLGVAPNAIRLGANTLMSILGVPDEDLIEGDPTDAILRKLQEEPRLIGRMKDAIAAQFDERGYPKVTQKVYPAVQEASKAVGDFVKTAPEGLGFLDTTLADIAEDTTSFWGGKLDEVAEAIGAEDKAAIVPKLLEDAEKYWKPKTQQIGREFDRRWDLRQEGKEAIARGPDDPGLLTAGDRQLDVGGLLRLAEEGDVTNVPPSERPRSGTGFPGPGLGEPSSIATAKKKQDQGEVIVKGVDPNASTVGGNAATQLDPATRAGLERVWGKHTYNPAQRRKKYMAQLNNIYKKSMWLDAIAAVSGGKSRSASYIERAVGMMETMQKFDQEERVYNIWRDVYYDKSGNYDPPKSKKDAAERARRLGANPEEVKAIYGWAEEDKDLQQWYRDDGKGDYETTTVKGKKTRPKGEGWIMGNPPKPRTPAKKQYIWAIPPGQTEAIYMDKDVVASQQGWTQSSIDKSGGLYGQSLRQAAQILKDGGEYAEGKARAILRQFYSRDPVTAGLFPENIDKVIDSLIESIRVSSGSEATAQQQTVAAAPGTLEEAVAAAIAHPSNAGKNPQEVRFDVEVWWQKNRGGG